MKALGLVILLSLGGVAQTAPNGDEYRKNEYYVGYSNQQVDDFDRTTFNGFELSYTRNVTRWIGIRGAVSGAYRNRDFRGTLNNPNGGTYTIEQENNRSVYNFLGGVQIKDNASRKRFKPFGFAMVGVAHNRSRFKDSTCTAGNCPANPLINVTFSDTGFAGSFGGGLDIKINDRVDFRAVQVDYNPIYSNSRVDNNVRFGVGFVIK